MATSSTNAEAPKRLPTSKSTAPTLPVECKVYAARIRKLADCSKLPQGTRDALKESYEQTSAAWASVSAEDQAALGAACKIAADAVAETATVCNEPAPSLPAACKDYQLAIYKLATCEKLPQATRDALRQSYEQTAAAWPGVPAEGRAALATACRSAADAVRQSSAACDVQLPAECNEYRVTISKLTGCSRIPQATRDALRQAYEQTAAAWASVPDDGKSALATACKSATEAVRQSAAACY